MTPVSKPARITWVDIARGLGIILVVLGHVWRGIYNAGLPLNPTVYLRVDDWIYAFHMPLFLALSGLFLARSAAKPAGSFFADKLATIVYPYVVWTLFQGVIQAQLSAVTNTKVEFWPLLPGLLFKPFAVFWFLYALMIDQAIYWLLARLLGGVKHLWTAPAILLVGYGIRFLPVPMALGPWQWLVVPYAYFQSTFVFVALGALLAPYLIRQWQCACVVGWGAAGLAAMLALTLLPHPGMKSALWVALLGICGMVGIAIAMDRLPDRAVDWLRLLGRRSLEIYVAQTMAASAIRIGLMYELHVRNITVHVLAGTVCGLLVPTLLAIWLERLGIRGVFRAPWIAAVDGKPPRQPLPMAMAK